MHGNFGGINSFMPRWVRPCPVDCDCGRCCVNCMTKGSDTLESFLSKVTFERKLSSVSLPLVNDKMSGNE